ncbi:unnamed protein product, partial [Brassica rapa subsp. narinosa]
MRVYINGLQPLIRKTTLEFDNGQELEISLVYEKVQNHCSSCSSLCHDIADCPEKQLPLAPSKDRQERQPSPKPKPPHRESPSEPSYSKRSSSQYHHRNAERAKVRGSSNIESERYNRRYERPSESYKYRNPPSTERTISARGQRRGETNYGPIRREHSLNSYQSLEYRRHEYRDHSHSSRHLQSAKALWVEKQKNKETQPANLELSESSRPHVIPPGETKDPHHPPANIPVEILDLARKEIRDYMEQYSNCQDPTESAARKERLRQAEEQGELEEAATSLVRNSLESQRIEEVIRVPEASPDRIPVSQRLGPISESQSAFNRLGSLTSPQARAAPLSLQSGRKRKAAKTPLRRTTPLSLAMVNAGIRKRRILKDTRSNKIIPPREENRSKRIPRNEEKATKMVAGGGLAILWKEWLNLEIISSCNNYFDTRITYEGNISYLTFIY